MGFDRKRGGLRRRFRSGRPHEDADRPRKRSNQFRRNRGRGDREGQREGRRFGDNERGRRPLRGRRIIRKRHQKTVPKDKDQMKNDLDRQMREYWVKSGSNKGKEEVKKDASLATKKMNEQMDDYWKKAKQKKQQQAQATEKKAPQA